MTDLKAGDTVRMHYTGKFTDGTTFDTSDGRDPLEFIVGAGHVVKGLDAALPGMQAGDKKTVSIKCEDAYGPINPGMNQAVPREAFPDDLNLEEGMHLQMQTPQGQPMPVTVTKIKDDEVILDANHPLAGRDLVFEIEIVSFDAE